MEASCDVSQFDEEVRMDSDEKLSAESCSRCENTCSNCMRPEMTPGGLCGNRPCGAGSNNGPGLRPNIRPGMRPGGRPNMRPGGPCVGRPCGGRPDIRPGGNCGGRPCGGRPNMRPDGGLPEGWRPSDGMRSNSVSSEMELHSEWNCGSRMIRDNEGRSMKVDCEGQTMSGCYMNDPMERLGDAFPPVMAYVPWQQWGDLYEPECGLKQGTIFKDLNYVFCGTRC